MLQNEQNSPSQEGVVRNKSYKNIPFKHKIIYVVGIFLAILVSLLFLAVVGTIDKRDSVGKYSMSLDTSLDMPFGMPQEGDLGAIEAMSSRFDAVGTKMMAPELTSNFIADDTIETVDKKIIKNGNLNLKVESIDWVSVKIVEIVRGFNGDVVRSNFYETADGVKNGTMTVKVPVAQFDEVFAEIKKIASLVVMEDTNSQDVTEQYMDLQAQLRNKQREEEAFAEILKRSGDIEDVLKVTKELSRVRGEIERLQGRIKLLESQTDMSTITIQLSEDVEVAVSKGWRPWEVIKESVQGLLGDSQNMIDFLIAFMIRGLPRLVIYGLILLVVYRIVRKLLDKMIGSRV